MNNTSFTQNAKTISNTPIILCLIFIPPVGVYLTFKYRPQWFKNIWFIVLLASLSLFWFVGLVDAVKNNESDNNVIKSSPALETKRITEKEVVIFTEERVDDSTINKGEEEIEREGINGERTITYEIKIEDGKEISKTKIKEEVTKEPVSKLTKVGTYVAPATTVPSQSTNPSTNTSDFDSGDSTYYANCTEAKEAGAAPIYKGQPGYRTALDRDKDGIACDK